MSAIHGYRGKSGSPAPAADAAADDTTPVDDCVQLPNESTPMPPADAAETAEAAA